MIKKHNQIISKIKTKYLTKTHKFGIFIPKDVKASKAKDAQNGNMLWWDDICKEMKNVKIAFELYDNSLTKDQAIKELKRKGYQQIDCHIIFDIKMGIFFAEKQGS